MKINIKLKSPTKKKNIVKKHDLSLNKYIFYGFVYISSIFNLPGH